MVEFPTYEQMAKEVAEKAFDECLIDGKSIREWIKIIAEQESKTVSFPEGATNGDAFKIMFNKTFPKTIIVYKNDESRLTINPMFAREWWEMPYKESEG